jgi:hypothetical protein
MVAGRGKIGRALILCHRCDMTAKRVAALLGSALTNETVELVYLDELIQSPHLSQRLQDRNSSSEFQLWDGRRVGSDDLALVFNRLRYVEIAHFHRAKPAERDYAVSEMFALLVSWLHSLQCPVLNPPSSQSLQGRFLSPLAWQSLALSAGLSVPELRIVTSQRRYTERVLPPLPDGAAVLGVSPESPAMSQFGGGNWPGVFCTALGTAIRTVLVLGSEVFGDIDGTQEVPCRNLARLSGFDILRLQFVQAARSTAWIFIGADPVPELTSPTEVAALTHFLLRTMSSPR